MKSEGLVTLPTLKCSRCRVRVPNESPEVKFEEAWLTVCRPCARLYAIITALVKAFQ